MTIGKRLREEREAMGLSQPKFAELVATTKQTLFSWETDKTSPGAVELAVFAANGVDVLYVLTGQRVRPPGYQEVQENSSAYAKAKTAEPSVSLNVIEKAVLDCAQQLNTDNQQMLYGIAKSMLETQNLRDAMREITSGKGADNGDWFD